MGGEGGWDDKIWFSGLSPVRAGLISRRKAQAVLWGHCGFPSSDFWGCTVKSPGDLSAQSSHTRCLEQGLVTRNRNAAECTGASSGTPSVELRSFLMQSIKTPPLTRCTIISFLLACSYLWKCRNSVCKYWTERIIHSNWQCPQLSPFDSSWQKLLFQFPCGRLLSFLGNHSGLKWDSLILESSLAVAPAVTWLICSPLSGTENFCSIRFLVTRVLLSSQLLGNKIRCLDCLARRKNVGFFFLSTHLLSSSFYVYDTCHKC